MDVIFNCPKCGQELEVDASGAGEEISCPSCSQKIRIPEPGGAPAGADAPAQEGVTPGWGAPTVSPIASSAAAKIVMHLKVPTHDKPAESLIAKPLVPLEAAAKDTNLHLKVKSIRHVDCVEVGHDKFDEMVTKFLTKIGEENLVSVTPLAYTHLDIASQKQLTDYGVLIMYRG